MQMFRTDRTDTSESRRIYQLVWAELLHIHAMLFATIWIQTTTMVETMSVTAIKVKRASICAHVYQSRYYIRELSLIYRLDILIKNLKKNY